MILLHIKPFVIKFHNLFFFSFYFFFPLPSFLFSRITPTSKKKSFLDWLICRWSRSPSKDLVKERERDALGKGWGFPSLVLCFPVWFHSKNKKSRDVLRADYVGIISGLLILSEKRSLLCLSEFRFLREGLKAFGDEWVLFALLWIFYC